MKEARSEEIKRILRENLRDARRKLGEAEQVAAAARLYRIVVRQEFFTTASRIVFYRKFDGEIDPSPLLQNALAQGKECFLPTVKPGSEDLLWFVPCNRETVLVDNCWGIGQPALCDGAVSPKACDVVFVPLVGFDAHFFRLGMGKGLYDRAFSFKIDNPSDKPLLVGLAHECQLTDPLPVDRWDVRLDVVVTAEKIHRLNAT